MTPRVTDQRARSAPTSVAQDPFDLDISVVESGAPSRWVINSDGGCGLSRGNACASSGS
ncbi:MULTISPECIES: FxLD family lanthipeptide [Streptomyces]|uniref:FxLD family lanthipeptide n=1 Tax=Streptomyces TaxID=1883 RepID=UPI00224882D4|nr:FxLD family lanthipeptide [Streptomyces sp. JHD 1]MCX2969408.1 FxLD family lanthipeptide [Streptomyces sp. JHD 1]